jgi:hypothetical protein
MAEPLIDPRVTKRRVTMRSVRLLPNGETATETATDYVREDHLDAYMADAAKRWQAVQVSDEFDAGPGGFDGMTCVPSALDLPDAGVVYPATDSGPTMLLSDPAPWAAPVGCPSPADDLAGFMAFHRAQFGDTAMIASGTGLRNTLYASYVGAATFADVYSTTGATAAGTAITGGAPAYASKGLTWGGGTNGVGSTSGTVFDIPSGATVAGFGVKTGVAGAYLDGGALTSQAFASQGTYTLTLTYTQT